VRCGAARPANSTSPRGAPRALIGAGWGSTAHHRSAGHRALAQGPDGGGSGYGMQGATPNSDQALLDDSPPFLKRQAPPRNIRGNGFRHFAFADLVTIIETPERKVLPAAQAPVVGILQNPSFRTAFGRVKLSRFVEDFKEHILHHIFGLTRIAKNSQSNFQDHPIKAIEQNR
jgi:hypothetical protein